MLLLGQDTRLQYFSNNRKYCHCRYLHWLQLKKLYSKITDDVKTLAMP
jgi:hypothetical protein